MWRRGRGSLAHVGPVAHFARSNDADPTNRLNAALYRIEPELGSRGMAEELGTMYATSLNSLGAFPTHLYVDYQATRFC